MKKFLSFESFSGKCTWCLLFVALVYALVFSIAGMVIERMPMRYSSMATERMVLR